MINPTYMANMFTQMERAPYDERYQAQMADVDAQIAAWGEIETALTSLQTATKALAGENDGFNSTTGSILPENSGASVSTGAGAIPGHHEMYVQQVAKAQQTALNFGPGGSIPTTGTLTLTNPTSGEQLDIDMAALNPPTVETLANTINAQGDALGVSAQVMTDTAGNYHLVMTSDKTGEDNAFTVNYSSITPPPTEQTLSSAQNAVVLYGSTDGINGIMYESQDNQLEDIIPGVTLSITQKGPLTVDIKPDTEAITTDVQSWVDSYNAMLDVFTAQVNTPEGGLYANGSARGMQSAIKNTLYTTSPDGQMLANYGITSDPYTGKLTLDTEKLQTALAENPEDVAALFKDVATQLDELIYGYTSTGGPIYTSQQTLEMEKSRIQADMDALDRRMEKVYQQYLAEFSYAAEVMSTMEATMAMFE
ncbi:flagellar filament capping protein FliD [Aeromonas aquatica]|uniref:flagellar filament capping protein FliD n=1 Tax=Aeromonas aquatica TaxID=558964 RepID=UPI00286EDA4A|nr:flagellar filament capping protein FliD [Aeromonas aquatica]